METVRIMHLALVAVCVFLLGVGIFISIKSRRTSASAMSSYFRRDIARLWRSLVSHKEERRMDALVESYYYAAFTVDMASTVLDMGIPLSINGRSQSQADLQGARQSLCAILRGLANPPTREPALTRLAEYIAFDLAGAPTPKAIERARTFLLEEAARLDDASYALDGHLERVVGLVKA